MQRIRRWKEEEFMHFSLPLQFVLKSDMMENSLEQSKVQPLKRPIFLTVLCILTFVGSGWGILSNLSSLFTSAFLTEGQMEMQQFSTLSDPMQQGPYATFMAHFLDSSIELATAAFKHVRDIAVLQLVLSVLSLLGAILMFYLRRIGFYLYVTAQILMLFVLPYFVGFSMLVILAMGSSAFFALLFILLYAIHLKYLH